MFCLAAYFEGFVSPSSLRDTYSSASFYNPGLVAFQERPSAGIGVQIPFSIDLIYLHPTFLGNFLVGGAYGKFCGAYIGFSKTLNKIGLGLLIKGGVPLGLNIGGSLPLDMAPQKIYKNIIFQQPVIGLSINVQNLFNPDPGFTLTTSGIFFKDKDHEAGLGLSVGKYLFSSAEAGFSIFENFRNFFMLRLGILASSEFGFSFGAGFKLHFGSLTGIAAYSWKKTGEEQTHLISVDFEFGTVDKEPPEVEFETPYVYISPNFDGKKDYLDIKMNISDQTLVGWRVSVVSKDGKPVKIWEGGETPKLASAEGVDVTRFREKESEATFWRRVKRIFIPQTVTPPTSLKWDCKTSKGQTVPDGEYKLVFEAWDYWKHYSKKEGTFNIDNTPPVIEKMEIPYSVFSPNGDGYRDTLLFEIKTRGEGEWKFEILDSSGKVVRLWSGEGEVPSAIEWDGTDQDGKPLPDGNYKVRLYIVDRADNEASSELGGILLTRAKNWIAVSCSETAFSPNEDGKLDTVKFKLEAEPSDLIKQWTLFVSRKGTAVWELNGKEVPAEVEWNGTDSSGKLLEDGVYEFGASASFEGFPEAITEPQTIVIDKTPPKCELTAGPLPFSPDWDGENDELIFKLRVDDQSPIKDWKLEVFKILEIYKRGQKKPVKKFIPFKTFTGTGQPAGEIIWDGKGDKGDLVESATDYMAVLTCTDSVGNVGKSKKVLIPVDVLVIPTPEGLKIRISTINFEFDSAEIKGAKSFKILNRVAQILKKYPDYKVRIVGHTDNIGSEEYNLKLSKKRAEAVKKYLIKKGISASRLTTEGKGESSPIAPNDTEEGRAKNRRVEFFLLKPKRA